MPTQDEMRAIIAATPDRYRALILTALFYGLRGSELRGLRWQDIDFKRGELHVRQRADRYNKLGPPKSDAGVRTIPISPFLLNTLKQWRLACPKGELDLAFPDANGGIESHAQILHRAFWPIQRVAGVVCIETAPQAAVLAARIAPRLRSPVDCAGCRPQKGSSVDGPRVDHDDVRPVRLSVSDR